MKRLLRLARALDPRALEQNASRAEALKSSTKALRDEVRVLGDTVRDLTAQLAAVQLRIDQLSALRLEEQDSAARLDSLAQVLDADRVSAHLREAVRQAAIVENPVPHGIVSNALPADVYHAVLDAIPPDVFFPGRDDAYRELLVPPRLAPTHSAATWAFLADFVAPALGSLLSTRFRQHVDAYVAALCSAAAPLDAGVTPVVTQGRIVLRRPGADASGRRSRPWDFLSVILSLAREDDSENYGSRLRGVDVPFRANSLLVVFDPAGAHQYSPIPSSAAVELRRYSYEFRVGLDADARRRLMARMDAAARGEWEALGR